MSSQYLYNKAQVGWLDQYLPWPTHLWHCISCIGSISSFSHKNSTSFQVCKLLLCWNSHCTASPEKKRWFHVINKNISSNTQGSSWTTSLAPPPPPPIIYFSNHCDIWFMNRIVNDPKWTKMTFIWSHTYLGHMCNSTKGSLRTSPMKIHHCMWIQWHFSKLYFLSFI